MIATHPTHRRETRDEGGGKRLSSCRFPDIHSLHEFQSFGSDDYKATKTKFHLSDSA